MKSMHDSCRRKSKQKEKQSKGNDKKEERLPPIKISLKGNTAKIIYSPGSEENLSYSKKLEKEEINASSEENLPSDSERPQRVENNASSAAENFPCFNIADKVKLRKRGQNSLSGGVIFHPCSQSSLPEKKRRKSYSSCSSLSSPSSVEAYATMSYSDCDKSLFLSLDQLPLTDGSSCDFPFKKAKLEENWNEKNQLRESSTSEDFLDIHQHDVALYEEVSTEPTDTSPFTLELHELKDNCDEVPALCNPHKEAVIYSANVEQKSLLIVENDAKKHIAEIYESIQTAAASITPSHHKNPVSKPSMLDIDVNLAKDKTLLSSPVEKAKFHAKELSMAKESSDACIRSMLSLAYQIMKQPNSKKNSTRENGPVISNHVSFALSSMSHPRPSENSSSVEKIESASPSTKQFSKSTSITSLSAKTHVRDHRNNHDNDGVFKQENHAAKEKRKAMDERCIVYVGNIPHGYSDLHLKKRFRRFGAIKDIQIKSKVRCDYSSSGGHSLDLEEIRNYGFITFSSNQEATDAIEKGNDGHELKFQLSFGARRQFVGEEYKDLDGIVAKNETSLYKRNSRSSFLSQNKEDDYSAILKGYIQERGVKPHSFTRMQCHA